MGDDRPRFRVSRMDFPTSYQESKKIFESMLCNSEHARWNYRCPEEGPGGDLLTVDVARLGPAGATSLLVISTGLWRGGGACWDAHAANCASTNGATPIRRGWAADDPCPQSLWFCLVPGR